MKSVHTPHDKFIKAVVKNLPVSEDLLRNSLPAEVLEPLELTQLELASESHIDEKLKPFMSDIVFKCPYKESTDGESHVKIPILVEHQSSPDELIVFRVYHYLFNFLYSEYKRSNGKKSNSKKLSAAYAIVLYHGEQTPYPYSLNLLDSFDDPHQIMKHFLENPIQLIDIGQIPDDELKKQKLIGVIQGALKHSRAKNPEYYIAQLLQQLAALDFNSQRELQLVAELITNYLFSVATSIDIQKIIDAGKKVPQPLRGEYMTIAEQLEARGIEKGAKLIATKMIKIGLSNEVITQTTDLTTEEIIELRQNAGEQ